MKANEVVEEYRAIKADYAYNPDVMCEDSERLRAIKEIINTRLSIADKTIILLYADCQSYRKLGKKMNLSHMTCRRDVLRIKEIILNEYEKMTKE